VTQQVTITIAYVRPCRIADERGGDSQHHDWTAAAVDSDIGERPADPQRDRDHGNHRVGNRTRSVTRDSSPEGARGSLQ